MRIWVKIILTYLIGIITPVVVFEMPKFWEGMVMLCISMIIVFLLWIREEK